MNVSHAVCPVIVVGQEEHNKESVSLTTDKEFRIGYRQANTKNFLKMGDVVKFQE